MEESTTSVDVVLVLTTENPGGDTVDDDAHGGGPDDESAVDFCRGEELLHTLYNDGAHGDEEDDGVEQRDEHRGLAVAVGETLGGVARSQLQRYHGEDEREDIAEVVAGIGEQTEGVADEARDGLDDDEGQVQRHRYYINSRQFFYRVRVVVMMVAVVMAVVMHMVIVMFMMVPLFVAMLMVVMVMFVFHNILIFQFFTN